MTSQVSLKFRTFANEGILLLMGVPGQDFLSLELTDGRVRYQYNLGSGTRPIVSSQTFNDGKWHTVFASRLKQDGLLKVDGLTSEFSSIWIDLHRIDL